MSWQPEIDEVERRRRLALELGGADKVARHKGQGKLTVRERIAGLVDAGSFEELGSIAGFPEYDAGGNLTGLTPANVICGRARIGGRNVFVTGDDFTVRGGANDGGLREKFGYAETWARHWRVPLVRLVDGTGGGGSVKHLETMGRTYLPEATDLHRYGGRPLGGADRGAGARLCRRHGRGPRVRFPLLDHGARHLAAVRRRPAGGGAQRARR